MRPPVLRISHDELIVDNFAGGGGASLGIEWALGRSPDIAINHDPEAIAMHKANHPATRHYCEDVWKVDPAEACKGRPVALAWFSPDCKHFSKAKGGKPVDKKIRGLAWVVYRWAKAVKPRVMALENVEEFEDWGPLLDDGTPCPLRKGFTFRRWWKQIENLGYQIEAMPIVGADHGAPTTRRRLFIVARRDGLPIVWPQHSHGGNRKPWRTAAECIDWMRPTYSIFLTKREAKKYGVRRPLADNTMRRIARGMQKFVIDNPEPFIVPVMHGTEPRVWPIDEPMRTITGAHRGDRALVMPYITRAAHGERDSKGKKRGKGEHALDKPLPTVLATRDFALTVPYLTEHANGPGRNLSAVEPLRTQCAEVKGGHSALIAPTLITAGYGERAGQAPRVPGLGKPLGTVVGTHHHALVAAFLAKHNAGHEATGQPFAEPMHTIVGRDQKALVASSLVRLKGTSEHGQQLNLPLGAVQAQGNHYAETRAFLMKYYGTDQDPRLEEPMHTLTSKHRMALVTVHGEPYVISDIGMRMLHPRELFRAQGFPDDYVIDLDVDGEPLTKEAQVRMVGNSVCPPVAAAIARAQFVEQAIEVVA